MKPHDEQLEVLVCDSYQSTLKERSTVLKVEIKHLIKELNDTLDAMKEMDIEKSVNG